MSGAAALILVIRDVAVRGAGAEISIRSLHAGFYEADFLHQVF
jgi:hypothetical protein